MSPQPSARERLLDAAEELAASTGVAPTPVDAILARAGVSPATLYAHFGGKEDLMAQALRRRLARWDAVWQESIDAATTPEDRVLAVFDALARYREHGGTSRWCVFLGAAAETPVRGPELDLALQQDNRLLLERLREMCGPVVGEDRSLLAARRVLLVYTGVLGMILRGEGADTVIEDGRKTAHAVLAPFVAPGPR